MSNKIQIRCKNLNNEIIEAELGDSLKDIYAKSGLQMEYGPVSARINNKVQGLNYRFYNSKDVEFLDLYSRSGMRVYTRTLFFILAKAVEDLFPDGKLIIQTPISKGYYCELKIGREISAEDALAIKNRMQEIIDADMPIHRVQCPIEEAIDMFRKKGMESKAQLLESQSKLYAYYYRLEDTVDYFYSCLLNSTGKIHLFDLIKFYDGLLLRIPSINNPGKLNDLVPQTKMLDVVREQQRWQQILGVRTVGEFNKVISAGYAAEMINVSEALQERKLSHIVDEIVERKSKIVLVAGPSSSGKTTMSKRLAILLMASGLRPHIISTDDYFVNRVDTPLDENGNYDFECIGAVDVELFNQQMAAILRGEEIELPRYDFPTGKRVFEGKKLKLNNNDLIILEGNHALNPIMSKLIDEKDKYRVYVSTMTTIALDDHNFVSTSDIRLLRRIIRDYRYRGYSALETINRGPSVARGEEKWITPFQENADATFNSALLYELGVMRNQVLPILEQVSECETGYAEASRLRKFLKYFTAVPLDQIPPTSLIREFAGGSSFRY
ncbi:MAG: nucleoside kinase [Bacteroidaceae bacterium]|nr:nucleoside kinase [Bacteroidaceae bacterium]